MDAANLIAANMRNWKETRPRAPMLPTSRARIRANGVSALSSPFADFKDAHDTSRCVNQTKAVRLFPSVPCGNRVRFSPGSGNNVWNVG